MPYMQISLMPVFPDVPLGGTGGAVPAAATVPFRFGNAAFRVHFGRTVSDKNYKRLVQVFPYGV